MTMFGIHTFATDETIQPAVLGPALEERGFGALFLPEHSHIPVSRQTPYPRGGELPREYYRALDPFVALGAVAAATRKLVLGTGVSLLVQRDTIQAAKEVATLEHLSGGRALLGVGVGWVREEMANHGTDPRRRGALLDEQLAAMIEIWTRDEAEYHGEQVDFDPIYAWPKPARRLPIYVGGDSAKAIARARRFGGWMPTGAATAAEAAEQVARIGGDVPVIINGVRPEPEIVAAYLAAGVAGITFHLPYLAESAALPALDELAALIA